MLANLRDVGLERAVAIEVDQREAHRVVGRLESQLERGLGKPTVAQISVEMAAREVVEREEIGPAVTVGVPGTDRMRPTAVVDARLGADLVEDVAPVDEPVTVETVGPGVEVLLADNGHVAVGPGTEMCRVDLEQAVAVHVEPDRFMRHVAMSAEADIGRNIREASRAVVVEQAVRRPGERQVQVHVAVVVVVHEIRRAAFTLQAQSGVVRGIHEPSAAVVAVQTAASAPGEEQIVEPVVVVVSRGHAASGDPDGYGQVRSRRVERRIRPVDEVQPDRRRDLLEHRHWQRVQQALFRLGVVGGIERRFHDSVGCHRRVVVDLDLVDRRRLDLRGLVLRGRLVRR